jgi:iron complex outermembrane recepter protein
VRFSRGRKERFDTQDIAGAPILENAGTVAQGGKYRYKTYLTTTYSLGGVSASLRWRHLPSVHAAVYAQSAATPFPGPTNYDMLDLTAIWEISQGYQVRLGIENLFDTQPQITNWNPATPDLAFSRSAGSTNPGYYDVLGRRYFVGFKTRF